MATELATAYISLIPELKGAGKSIASQLGGVDVAPTGRKLGKSLSDGISSGIDSSGIRQLENAVASASQKVGRAMASENDATNQLKIAQQRLIEVRSKYAEGSSQVMAAEAKVESAQRKAVSTSERTKSAQVELKRAQEQLSAANKKVSSSSDDASRGIASMGKASGSVKGALGALTKVAGPALAAIGFSQLVGEAAAATDATKKFKSTLDFAGLGTPEIEALSKSTRKYADETVYALSDIQNITAQLAANSVPNYDKLAEAAGNLNAVAGGNAETFSSVGMVLTQTAGAGKLTTENWNQLADAIPGASGKLQEAMLKNGAYTGNFREAMEKGEISAEEFNQAIMDLGFEDAAVNAAKSTSTFEGAFGNMKASVVGGLSDTLAKIQPFATSAINAFTPVIDGAFGLLLGGFDLIGQAAQDFGAKMQPAVQPVIDAFTALKDNFEPIIAQVRDAFMPAMDSLGGALTDLAVAVMPIVEVALQTVGPFVADVVGYFIDFATTIATYLTPIVQGFADFISAVMPVIQGVFQAVMPVVSAITKGAFSQIENVITTVMGAVQSVIDIALAVINGDWGAAWEGIKSLFSDVWEGIKNGAKIGVDTVVNVVKGVKDSIVGFFSNAGEWLIDAGKSILHGLWDGISGALGWLGDQLAGIGDFIVQHKGPPSYDAVMLVKNGELIMGGLLDGMTRGWGDVEDFVKSRNTSLSASYSVTTRANSRSYAPCNQNTELYGLLRDIRAAMPEYMTPREFRRAVAACG